MTRFRVEDKEKATRNNARAFRSMFANTNLLKIIHNNNQNSNFYVQSLTLV